MALVFVSMMDWRFEREISALSLASATTPDTVPTAAFALAEAAPSCVAPPVSAVERAVEKSRAAARVVPMRLSACPSAVVSAGTCPLNCVSVPCGCPRLLGRGDRLVHAAQRFAHLGYGVLGRADVRKQARLRRGRLGIQIDAELLGLRDERLAHRRDERLVDLLLDGLRARIGHLGCDGVLLLVDVVLILGCSKSPVSMLVSFSLKLRGTTMAA